MSAQVEVAQVEVAQAEGTTQGPTGPAASTSMADRAYEVVRDRLLVLDIRPGDPVKDDVLARELGVGRTPVREALKRLEADRLLVSYPRRGTFATGVDITDLAHISAVRQQLEPLAAASAARDAGPGVRAGLRDLADDVEALDLVSLGWRELMRHDVTVHRALYRACGNPYLEDVLVRHDNLATRIWCLFVDRLPSFAGHVGEHVELLRAVADGRGDEAAALAREHVTGFERAVRAVL